MGVLFWSTFTTPVTFYIFVIVSLLIRPLSRILNISRNWAFETKPLDTMVLSLVLAFTFMFWGGVVLYYFRDAIT